MELKEINERMEVEESIKKIDDKLLELRSEKNILKAKRQELIEENLEAVLMIDLEVISKTISVFNKLCRKEYPSFAEAESLLYLLLEDVNDEIINIKTDSSVNAVEEPIGVESK